MKTSERIPTDAAIKEEGAQDRPRMKQRGGKRKGGRNRGRKGTRY